MQLRTYASFVWSTEEDGEFDSAGNVVSPGGRRIADQMQQFLAKNGVAVTAPENHEDFGWSFEATANSVRVWCLLQFAEPWLLITDVPSRWWHRLHGRNPDKQQININRLLHEAIAGSGRASAIQWFTPQGFEQTKGSGGAPAP